VHQMLQTLNLLRHITFKCLGGIDKLKVRTLKTYERGKGYFEILIRGRGYLENVRKRSREGGSPKINEIERTYAPFELPPMENEL